MAAIHISNGQISAGLIVANDSMYISNGGEANSTTVNGSGIIYISSGGVANYTTVNDRGSMYISSGGVANYTTLSWAMYISNGGVANYTTVNSRGAMYISSGGVANSTAVNSDGRMIISGGTANNTTVNSYGSLSVSNGGKCQDTIVNDQGRMLVYSGVASDTTVNSGGTLHLDGGSGIFTYQTTINSGGEMITYGGVINNTTVKSGGSLVCYNVNGKNLILSRGAVLGGFSFEDEKKIDTITNGSAILSPSIYISGYNMTVSDGGVATGTTVGESKFTGDIVLGVSGGNLRVYSGGIISKTIAAFGGTVNVYSGGIANSTLVDSGGSMCVYSGGSAFYIKENGGYVDVKSGANVSFIPNTIDGLTLSHTLYENTTLHSGTVANNMTVNWNGALYIFSSGLANNTTFDGGYLYIYNGGVASNTTVKARGGGNSNVVKIYSGGVHKGRLNMNSVRFGTIVSAYQGAIIDFTVADVAPQSDYLINNVSQISGAPTYTITVKADQKEGTYNLAQEAGEFTGTLTIGDDSKRYGNITVNGDTVTYNNVKYTLRQKDGNLNLFVGDFSLLAAPTYTLSPAEGWTAGDVVITVVFDKESVLNEYSLDNGSKWLKCEGNTITVSNNGTVLLRSSDSNGFSSMVTTVDISNIDKEKPVVSAVAETPSSYVSKVAITVSATDSQSGIDKIEYSLDKKQWFAVSGNSYTATANGTVYFRATDKVGLVSDIKSVSVSKIDVEKPTLLVTGNPTEFTEESVVLAITATDKTSGIDKVEYSIDGADYKSVTLDAQGRGTLTIDKNCKVTVRAFDKAGLFAEEVITVDKIEKDAPVITIKSDPASWTNAAVVTVSATATDDASGVKSLEYWNGTEWVAGSSVEVTENNTVVKFKAVDNFNRSSEKSFTVNFIDRIAPSAVISGNSEKLVKELTLSVSATDDASGISSVKYSFDNRVWNEGKSVLVTANGTVYFQVTDKAGNVVTVSEKVVNIDNVKPELTVTGNPAAYQENDVILRATATDNLSPTVFISYSLDNKSTWQLYSDDAPCVVTGNQTVYFRAVDSVGNITEKAIVVDKIDKDNPVISVSGYDGKWINKDVVLTINATDASSPVVKTEYRIGDNGEWISGKRVVVTENTKVYFRATDSIGHVTTSDIVIDKIDKIAPAAPQVSADITSWVNKDVTLSAVFAADSVKNEYSVNGGAYQTYTSSGVIVSENGTVDFRSTDAAGNIAVTAFEVKNIDKTAPVITVSGLSATRTRRPVTVTADAADSASGAKTLEYSFDNKTWRSGASVTVTENCTIYFRAGDVAGNTGVVTAVVDNIVETPPDSSLLGNGTSQITGFDSVRGKVGFVAVDGNVSPQWQGVWEWSGKDISTWRVAAVGKFAGSASNNDGLLLQNTSNNTFAAWSDLGRGDYGYVSLATVDGNFSAVSIVDLGGSSKFDDVLIKDENGSTGVVIDGTTYHDIWHVNDGEYSAWEFYGSGNFGDNISSLVARNCYTNHLVLWANNDITFETWDWSIRTLGYLGNDFDFAAVGDFYGDETDDILVRNNKDNSLWVWDDGNASTARWVVTPEKGFAVEGVGDYNGDCKDDILVREYNTKWGGLGYYAPGTDTLWNDLNARIETGYESNFAIIA